MKAFLAAILIFGMSFIVWRTIVWDRQRRRERRKNKKEN